METRHVFSTFYLYANIAYRVYTNKTVSGLALLISSRGGGGFGGEGGGLLHVRTDS